VQRLPPHLVPHVNARISRAPPRRGVSLFRADLTPPAAACSTITTKP